MTDKEKIKQEIEKLKTQNETYPDKEYAESIKWYKHGAYDTCFQLLNFINSLPEEHNEDLEEYYKKEFLPKEWFAKPGHRTISQFNFFTAQHFAEWQEKQMLGIAEAFYEQGRFEQKQEMMKDAVDGEVVYQIGSSILAPTDIRYKVVSDRVYIPNVKLGDKVKIIIVKENK